MTEATEEKAAAEAIDQHRGVRTLMALSHIRRERGGPHKPPELLKVELEAWEVGMTYAKLCRSTETAEAKLKELDPYMKSIAAKVSSTQTARLNLMQQAKADGNQELFALFIQSYDSFIDAYNPLAELYEKLKAEVRGYEKANARALTLVDEMTEMKKRHKKELDELKAFQKMELRQLEDKYSYWWASYKVRSRTKVGLQGEFAWLYHRVTNDKNKVLAWGGSNPFDFDTLRAEILTKLWAKIPKENRKGVYNMKRKVEFSYDSLKRHYREHLDDYTPPYEPDGGQSPAHT